MRKIKFRAWDRKSKSFVGVHEVGGIWINTLTVDGARDHEIIFMQFTGLKDKNGKEIFECDIINHNGITDIVKSTNLIVVFTEGAFCLSLGLYPGMSEAVTIRDAMSQADIKELYLEIEVKGNIYENPELLTNG